MLGRVVGNYRIVEKIGEGGMGAVYRAFDEMLDREVAIKAIRPELAREPQIVERFRAEAKILARVSHPSIATIYSFFHDGGELFLAMEFVAGRTLAEVIADHGALPWQRAVPLLATALEGIEQAHRAGIIHRDLKPDNLMLTEAGTLKVMDFGIARMTGSSHLTQTGLLMGTLRYLAPEQIRGEEVDQRTDIYSLGAVLYQMLTARVPFDGPTDFAILKAQLDDPPMPPSARVPGLPGWLDHAVLKALEKEPSARFQTVEELRLHLKRQGAAAGGARSEPTAEFPTLILPPRPERTGSAVVSAATMETDRPRPPQSPSPPRNPAPPPISGTSYRPVEGTGWKRGAIAVLVFLVVVAAGIFLWMRRGSEAPSPLPPVTTAADAGSAAVPDTVPPAQTEATPAAGTVSSPSGNPTVAAQPPQPLPAPRLQEKPKPVSPPSSPPPTSEAPAAAPQRTEPAPAEPAPSPEAPNTAPETPPAGEIPAEELSRLGGELVAGSEKLVESYANFLEQKEDGGAELTESDEKLQEELELLADAANRFNKRFKEGFFGHARDRFRKTDQHSEVVRRFRDLAAVATRVDRLMAQVQPGPEVRQDWQEVRSRWVRVSEILRAR
ncbi:MAG TPA: serine/threonine-protein kinase [Thermoanaerobaculia bacterium]|jgi:serine/threonine-protein kinase|nr:serine/threonine-protein kinase [Thermoanaerobaculia bacterium]